MNLQSYILKFWCIILPVIFLLTGLTSCQNDGSSESQRAVNSTVYESDTSAYPEMTFDTQSYDFGRVYEGEIPGWSFVYVNSGDRELIINNVTADCGCTIPSYSKAPVTPGQQERVRVLFNTSGRSGKQLKKIKVETNGKPAVIELTITAEIVKNNK